MLLHEAPHTHTRPIILWSPGKLESGVVQSDHVTWILASGWPREITLPETESGVGGQRAGSSGCEPRLDENPN